MLSVRGRLEGPLGAGMGGESRANTLLPRDGEMEREGAVTLRWGRCIGACFGWLEM
jgi:hypothetical protein